jgi:hypothetical protein
MIESPFALEKNMQYPFSETDFRPDETLEALPEHIEAALADGPARPQDGLPLEKADDLLKPGYLPLETGYTRLPNGQLQVACLTKMPGCKGRMINWWFRLAGKLRTLWLVAPQRPHLDRMGKGVSRPEQ